jgi:hypothetical protein
MKKIYALICTLFFLNAVPAKTSLKSTACNTSSSTRFSLESSTLMPIQLLYFTAALNEENNIELEWATAVEINNDFFTVERTADGLTYETIATIEGAGSSSQQHAYSAVDYSPPTGVSYYRLKQTDENGNSTSFGMQMISYEPVIKNEISVYPNPGDGTVISVSVAAAADEKITITVSGAYGQVNRVVNAVATNDGMNTIRIEFPSTLQPGMYFVEVASSNGTNTRLFGTEKIIIQ